MHSPLILDLAKQLTKHNLWSQLFTLFKVPFVTEPAPIPKRFHIYCENCKQDNFSIFFLVDPLVCKWYCSCGAQKVKANNRDSFVELIQLAARVEVKAKDIVAGAEKLIKEHLDKVTEGSRLSEAKRKQHGIYGFARKVAPKKGTKPVQPKKSKKAKTVRPKSKMLNEGEYVLYN